MSDALHALLSYDQEPTKEVYVKRFGVNFKIKGLTQEEHYSLRDQATYSVKGKKNVNELELDGLLIATGVTEPNFNDAQVIKKFGAKDGADAVTKALLFGEIKTLQAEILKLSGFDDEEEEIEEIKN